MPLSRAVLAGALHIARNHTSSSGSCHTNHYCWAPAVHEVTVPGPGPLHKLRTGNVKWSVGSLWEQESRCWPVSALGEGETAGRDLCPHPISRLLQENALCSPRGGWNNMQAIGIIPSQSCFPGCQDAASIVVWVFATGEHHLLWTVLWKLLSEQGFVLPCLTSCRSGCQEHLKHILNTFSWFSHSWGLQRKENGSWWQSTA